MMDDRVQYHELQNLDKRPQARANEPQLKGREVWKLRFIQALHGLNLGLLYVALFAYLELLGLGRRSIGALMIVSFLENALLSYFVPQWLERTTAKTLVLGSQTVTVLCGAVLSVTLNRWTAFPAIAGCVSSWGLDLGFLSALEGDILSAITGENRKYVEMKLSFIWWHIGVFLGMTATIMMLYTDEQAEKPPNPTSFAYAFMTFTVLELVILLLVYLLDCKKYAERQASTQEADDEKE